MQPGLTIIPPSSTKTYSSPEITAKHPQSMMSLHAISAQAVLNGVNGYAAPDATRTLFLGDLSYFCTEQDLCRLFIVYGSITSVRVRRGVTGESLMHGFITLGSPEAALRALRDLDGVEFMGRNMRVQLSTDGQRPNPVAKETFVQVHVSFISKQTNILVSERVLREIFAPFGRIADVTIKKHTLVPKQNRQSGYGFVYYFDVDAANHAMSVLKQNTVHDITLDCSISYKSQHDKHSHPHTHRRMYPPRGHSLSDLSVSQWDINAPDVRSFSSGSTSSGSQSTAHLSSYQQTIPRTRSPVNDFPAPRSAAARHNYNNGAAMHANPPRGISPSHANLSLPRERHYEQESRVYTGEELEAELARMSLALHQHYQERELERERERERELAWLAQPPRTFSGRDWEDQSQLSFTSGSVSRAAGPLPQLNSFHSLSSISQGSTAYHPQTKTRPQLTRAGPQFDSFSSDDEPVTVNSFAMSELDRLLPPPPSDSVFGARDSQQQPQQQRYMSSNAFPEDQARALNQLIDFDFHHDLSLQ